MTSGIRIVLAEDHVLVRAGLRTLIEQVPGMAVVGEAADGREAIAVIAETLPDVVLLDITMPGQNGLLTAARVRTEYPQVGILMLSMHDNEEYVWQALNAGAAGYLLKEADPDELTMAIRAVARGGSYLSPVVQRHVVQDYLGRTRDDAAGSPRLTPRQLEIIQLIAEGRTNREIARELEISVKTVETHRAQIMDRIDVHDVPGIVRYAVRMGLVPADA